MSVMLKGRKALLLAEGCKLKKQMKALEARLTEIRDEISLDRPATYVNEAGDELVLAETERFSDISPGTVLNYLKKQRMANRFPEIVKVQVTALRKVVPESMIDKWRSKLDSALKWTWK